MCVIVVQPAGEYLTKEDAKAAWDTNPDGGGFAYIHPEDGLTIYKSMDFHDFWSKFERARSDHRDADFLVHMRIATHGSVCLDNTHPFQVNEHTAMAHNGIIHGVPDDKTGADRSDTRMFIDCVLPDLPDNWLDREYLADMVAEWIGWSRLVFLTNDPRLEYSVYILNEKKGDWIDGLWYSNTNHWFKSSTPKVTTGTSTSVKFDSEDMVEVNGVLMSIEAYEDWWAGKMTGEKKENKTSFDTPFFTSYKEIQNYRAETHGLTWPLYELDGAAVCTMCDTSVIRSNDYECSCYWMACERCLLLAEFCACSPTERDLTFLDDLDSVSFEAVAERTHEAIGTTPPHLERRPSSKIAAD